MGLDPEAFRLDGKVAVVTGGGAGIGRGIANGLTAFGAMVAIWERDADTCAAAADEVGGLSVPTDVRDGAQVDAAVQATLDEYGTVDVLVNNAGGVFASSILDTSENGFDALYRANLRHVLICTQRVARVMVDAGRGGSIVNVTSIEGVRAAPGYAAYAAAKAGVINLTKTAALELAPYAIRVNALAPDITMTEGLAALMVDGRQRSWEHTVPLGRAGTVDDIAGSAVFLASSLSSYLTGQTLHVDGGTEAGGGWYHHPATGDYVLGPSSSSDNGHGDGGDNGGAAHAEGAITSSP
jgi:NAD(P)-dependent dehydrogenase (short-subunit alcohol dehydrogenase family)